MRYIVTALLRTILTGVAASVPPASAPAAAPITPPLSSPSPFVASVLLPGDVGTAVVKVDPYAARVVVLTGSRHRFLSTLDGRDGHLVQHVALGGPVDACCLGFDVVPGRAIVVSQRASATIATLYDDRSLAVLGTARVSAYATSIRVDAARQRLLVLNGTPQNKGFPADNATINTVSMVDLSAQPPTAHPRRLVTRGLFSGGKDVVVQMSLDAATGNLVLITDHGREYRVLLVDPASGTVLHTSVVPYASDLTVTLASSYAFAHQYPPVSWVFPRLRRIFARFGHTLAVIDADNGRVVGSRAVRHAVGSLMADERAGRVFGIAAATGDETAAPPRRVDVFDGRTGDLIASTVTRGDIQTFDQPAPSVGSPAAGVVDVLTGRFFVPTIDPVSLVSGVEVFDARTGALTRHIGLDGVPTLIVDARASRVLALRAPVGSGSNALSVLDASTGAVVATYPRGGYGFGVTTTAVDENAHRAYAVDGENKFVVLRTVPS